jgi:hypothetical protein
LIYTLGINYADVARSATSGGFHATRPEFSLMRKLKRPAAEFGQNAQTEKRTRSRTVSNDTVEERSISTGSLPKIGKLKSVPAKTARAENSAPEKPTEHQKLSD